MFTTDAQLNFTKVLQLQSWVESYLEEIPQVVSAQAILQIPRSRNFVAVDNREEPRASIRVTLRQGESLTNKQIDGIYLFVRNAVTGIKQEDITVTDGNGIFLIPGVEDETDPGAELIRLYQRYTMEAGFTELMAENAFRSITPAMERVFGEGNIAISVRAILDTSSDREVREETFTPVDGTTHGVLRRHLSQMGAGGTLGDGGVVGTPPNADIAPNYPTIPDIETGQEFFLEQINEVQYEISNRLVTYRDNGLRVDRITAGVIVNREPITITPARAEEWREFIAHAVGTDIENVTFLAEPFLPEIIPPPIPDRPGSLTRNILIWIIVCLGVLLIILFVLAIMTSNSRKKRLVRTRGFAPVAEGPNGYLQVDSYQPVEEQAGFDLPSLLDENETKDVVLKREIREFTRSNPEIIAQLIRTWLREEDN
jgi:flagellar M-ring protein FliF